jgi:ribosomal protein S6
MEETKTNKYDLTVLLREENDSPLRELIKKYTKGDIKDIKPLTKVTLAYEIDGEKKAFMVSLGFEMETQKVEKLNQELKLNNNFLRHMILIQVSDLDKKLSPKIKKEEKTKFGKKFVSNEDLEERIKEISE